MTTETPADRLRAALLTVAGALVADRPPVVVHEWADTPELHGEPVGHRYFALVAAERGAGAGSFDEVLTAFGTAGWAAHRWNGHAEGTGWATAKRDGLEVSARQGRCTEVVVLSGRTPVVFVPGRETLRRPLHTLSTGSGVLCSDCQGWGICLVCEGTGRHHAPGRMTYGRCVCWAGQAGPGRCADCAGEGRITSVPPSSSRRPGDALSSATEPAPPAEAAPASALDALVEVARRPCACGGLACHWQLTRTRTELRVSGPCQSCARPRSYSFPLPAAR